MSILCSRQPVFDPRQQFHARRCVRPLVSMETFISEVYRYIFENWGVQRKGVLWLTVQDPLAIYHKVIILKQTIQEECQLDFPSLYIKKKIGLQIYFRNFEVIIRPKGEYVVERIDVRQDPNPRRHGYRICRWPKPFDPHTRVINTDASVKDDRAGVGCIFRTNAGEPLKAYAAVCLKMKVHVIEVFAVQKGVRIAVEDEMQFIVIETDASIAVSIINTIAAAYSNLVGKCEINHENYLAASSGHGSPLRGTSPRDDTNIESFVKTVVKSHARWSTGEDATTMEFLVKSLVDIVYSLESFSGWGCRHILREANGAADFLTKEAVKEDIVYVKQTDYPAALLKIINKDADDHNWYQRQVPTPFSSNIDRSTGWRLVMETNRPIRINA